MRITVKTMMLNWVHETSATADVALSEETTENVVCTVTGAEVLFTADVENMVDLMVFISVVYSRDSVTAGTSLLVQFLADGWPM